MRPFVFFRHSRSKNPINVFMDLGFALTGWSLVVFTEEVWPRIDRHFPAIRRELEELQRRQMERNATEMHQRSKPKQ